MFDDDHIFVRLPLDHNSFRAASLPFCPFSPSLKINSPQMVGCLKMSSANVWKDDWEKDSLAGESFDHRVAKVTTLELSIGEENRP